MSVKNKTDEWMLNKYHIHFLCYHLSASNNKFEPAIPSCLSAYTYKSIKDLCPSWEKASFKACISTPNTSSQVNVAALHNSVCVLCDVWEILCSLDQLCKTPPSISSSPKISKIHYMQVICQTVKSDWACQRGRIGKSLYVVSHW